MNFYIRYNPLISGLYLPIYFKEYLLTVEYVKI